MKELINSERKEKLIEVPPVVIKIGGNSLVQENTVLEDIVRLHKDGNPLIIVHGGGPAIDKALQARNINPRRKDGVRITDEETLKTVAEVSQHINKLIELTLIQKGINAVGTNRNGNKLLRAVKANHDLGFVGQISEVNKNSLQRLLAEGMVPVISPIVSSENNNSEVLNVNSDTVAGRIAASFPRSSLIMLSDVPGVKIGENFIKTINKNVYDKRKKTNDIRGGMIPKIDACFDALENGSFPRIINPKIPHSILIALKQPSFGTRFSIK